MKRDYQREQLRQVVQLLADYKETIVTRVIKLILFFTFISIYVLSSFLS